jgi:ATP-dependent exoDNAse (exonuclease V) beta subunit
MVDKFDIRKVVWLKGYRDLPTAYYPSIKVPGVTTILGDMIPDPDYEKFVQDVGEEKAKEITQAAWDRGTSMHCFIENFVKELAKSKDPSLALQHTQLISQKTLLDDGVPMEKIDKGREMFLNFYYSDYSNAYVDLIGTELSLYSPSLFFRGKTDVFYNQMGFGRVVTDFKTSSKPIEKGTVKELKYKIQLGAYAIGIEHMFKEKNVKVNKSSILVMQTKSTLIQEIFCQGEELEEQKKEFETLVKAWHIKNNQGFLFPDGQ